MNVDYTDMVDEMLNLSLLKHKEAAPIVKLLNKYGIKGARAISFIMEMNEIGKEMGQNNEVDNTN